MPLAVLVLVFIVLPITELYVIYLVGDLIGWWQTLLLLAADSVIGSLLLRSQGRAVWARFQEAMTAGRMPHQEVQDGVAVIFGGAFLITPGFLTDFLGLALLLPPSRRLVLRLFARRVARFMATRVVVRRTRPGGDVEGTATEYPPTDPPRIER